ncbi:MAG: tRNA pseudouridine(55) synthase TruB [Spirochaetia bacterium]|nr:tRNA pseudouridine(55) synthase TruB [Spirochaetia bacterium]
MDGILLINKEKGPTSFGAIEAAKKKYKLKKIGHSGTLDPQATGLLLALVGKATRVNEYLPSDKEYDMEITFGRSTTTDDIEGETVKEGAVPADLETQIKVLLPQFVGAIMQVPPKFSAVRKDGKKLYELARAGDEVVPEPRQVTIESIDFVRCESPKAWLKVHCSAGTYMRSIARDLGEKIGCGAHLSDLTRTRIGAFRLADAIKISETESIENKIIPMKDALYNLPTIILTTENYGRVKNGMPVDNHTINKSGWAKMVYEGDVVAIGQIKYGKVYVKRGI